MLAKVGWARPAAVVACGLLGVTVWLLYRRGMWPGGLVRRITGLALAVSCIAVVGVLARAWLGALQDNCTPDCVSLSALLAGLLAAWWAAMVVFEKRLANLKDAAYVTSFAVLGVAVLFVAGAFEAATAVLATLAVAWVLGRALLAWFAIMPERPALDGALMRVALGLGILSVLGLALGTASLLYGWMVALIYAGVLVFGGLRWRGEWLAMANALRTRLATPTLAKHRDFAMLLLLLGFVLTVNLVASLGPEWSSDALGGRLAAPMIYAREHAVSIKLNIWPTASTIGCETLYALLASLTGDQTAPRLMHYAAGVLAIFTVFSLARRLQDDRAGVLAALVVAGSSLVWFLFTSGYTDLVVLYLGLAAGLMFLVWLECDRPGLLCATGLLIGLLSGMKLTGGFMAIAMGGAAALRMTMQGRKGWWRAVLCVGAFEVVVFAGVAPWLVRSYAITGNPLFPWLGNIFRSPLWPDAVAHVGYRFSPGSHWFDYLRIPVIASFERGQLVEGGLISPLLLLFLPAWVGVAWLKGHQRYLALYVAVLSLGWAVTDPNLRYGLVQVALVGAVGAAILVRAWDVVPRSWAIANRAVLSVVAVSSIPYMFATSFWYGSQSHFGFPHKVVFGRQSQKDYLDLFYPIHSCISYLNRTYGESACVWAPHSRDFLYPRCQWLWLDSVLGKQPLLRELLLSERPNAEFRDQLLQMGMSHLLIELYDSKFSCDRIMPGAKGPFRPTFLSDPRCATLEYAYKGYYLYKLVRPGDRVATAAFGDNLLADSGLEANEAKPTKWLPAGMPARAVAGDAHSGNAATWVDNANFLMQEVPVSEGQLYRLQFAARFANDKGWGRRELSWRDGAGRVLNQWWATPFSAGNRFSVSSLYETAPPGAKSVIVMLRTSGPSERCLVDDVRLQPVNFQDEEVPSPAPGDTPRMASRKTGD